MNFLRHLLSQEQRDKLLDKIRIEVYNVTEDGLEFERFGTDLEKEKWLFQTRNNYTHNLFTVEKHYTEGYLDVDDNWVIWEETHSENCAQRVLTRESFKEEIEESIIIGIAETIERNS